MDADRRDEAAPDRSPPDEADAVADSAPPGKKAIDDTSESSEERREHPGLADPEDGG